MKKWIIVLLMICCMVMAVLPVTIFAADVVASGYCGGEGDGTNLTWKLDGEGGLTISGTGAMDDYGEYGSLAPWYNYGYYGYSDYDILNITIDEGVTSIGNKAFSGCGLAKSCHIPNSVTRIGDYAFSNCFGLSEINLSDNITHIGEYAFSSCERLVCVELSTGLSVLEKCLFRNCVSLTDIILKDGLCEIGNGVFSDCTNLKELNIPKSVNTFPLSAVSGCVNLQNVHIEEGNENYFSIEGVVFDKSVETLIYYPDGKEGEYIVPESVITIGTASFNDSSITNLLLPDSLQKIEDGAFAGCNITKIYIPDSVTFIGEKAFSGCENLVECKLPMGLTEINEQVFYHCASLKNFVLPDNIKTIGYEAFRGALLSSCFVIPDNVKTIGMGAFYASGIEKLFVGKNVGYINDSAFSKCWNLQTINVYSDSIILDRDSFSWCSNLSTANFYGKPPNILHSNLFEYSGTNFTIFYDPNISEWVNSKYYSSENGTWYGYKVLPYDTDDVITEYLQVAINNSGRTYYVGEEVHIILTDVTKTEKYNSFYADIQYTKPQNLLLTNSNETVLKLKRYDDLSHDSAHIEYVFTAKKAGTTVISIDDDVNQETIHLPITVTEDTLKSYRADKVSTVPYELLNAKDEFNYFINGIYIADFKCSDNEDGTWQYTFNAYNELYTPGIVEVYNADGKLIEVEIIEKFADLASIKEVIEAGKDMFTQFFKRETFSFRGVSSAKETPISVRVPQDGFVRITNSSAVSKSCLFVSMFDYLLAGLELIESDYDFDNTTTDYVTKEILWKVLYSEVGVDLLEDIQKRFTNTALKGISENAVKDYYQILTSDINKLFQTLEIDLAEIAKGSMESAAWGGAQGFIEKFGGPAGMTLNGVFTVQNALNFLYQTKDLSESAKSRIGVDIYTPTDRSYREITSLDGNYITSISELPDETILQVFKLTDNEEVEAIESTADYELYEISLQVDGEDYQPDEPITVYLRKPYGFGINGDMKLYRQNKDGEWEEIQYTIENGMLVFQIDHFCLFAIIEHFKIGDVNQDGNVNELDSEILTDYFSGQPVDVTITPDTADLNDDSRVTRADAMILARYLAKWPGYADKYFQ